MLTEQEIEIIDGCRKGDQESQRMLYDIYGPMIKGICVRYAGDIQEAEDMFHDIFVFILTHFEGYDKITSLGGWLRTITVNKVIDHLRKQQVYRTTPMSSLNQEFGDMREPNYDGIPMEVLLRMINELPPKYRTAFNLYVVDEVQQEEIARMMGETPNNVRSLIFRAKAKLRQRIEKYLKTEEFRI
ncbi:MAG: RNA polymerase sigma factor [Bacteroidales bacterium]|nr:RNA polymerase sigma factor [Bacteroidales bacterium]